MSLAGSWGSFGRERDNLEMGSWLSNDDTLADMDPRGQIVGGTQLLGHGSSREMVGLLIQ